MPPVLISERFLVEDGLIHEIEAIFFVQESFDNCSGACFLANELGHEAPFLGDGGGGDDDD